jgi:hypothetical protein
MGCIFGWSKHDYRFHSDHIKNAWIFLMIQPIINLSSCILQYIGF